MGQKFIDENVELMRGVLGSGPSEMDLVRALHLAKNDVTLAFNVLFDTLGYKGAEINVKRTTAGSGARLSTASKQESEPCSLLAPSDTQLICKSDTPSEQPLFELQYAASDCPSGVKEEGVQDTCNLDLSLKLGSISDIKDAACLALPSGGVLGGTSAAPDSPLKLQLGSSKAAIESLLHQHVEVDDFEEYDLYGYDAECGRIKWLLLGDAEVLGYSTCKGSKLKAGDLVSFTFPKKVDYHRGTSSLWGRGRGAVAAAQQIVRFNTPNSGDIGRLPGDWAKCLIPLMSGGRVKVEGRCRAAPEVLTTMDTVMLSIRLYASSALLRKYSGHPSRLPTSLCDETIHPLPSLFRLLGKEPFKKAEFTPENLYSRKRAFHCKDAMLPAEKRMKLISNGNDSSEQAEEILSDTDLNRLVGTTESQDLEEMEPPSNLLCELRPYQKQALYWMTRMESGLPSEEASKTLHPCWDGFHLADRWATPVYLNVFSGEATMDFPSALKLARGGILADAMGLGKTVMTIALLLSNPGRGSGSGNIIVEQVEAKSSQSKGHSCKSNACKKGGGTLIVCPMTLLSQWKTEIETHSKEGALSVYAHYGAGRTKDPHVLLGYDVVITTYGILSSDHQNGDGPLQSIQWFRVVLDEAHTIKASKCQSAQAAFNLSADTCWCLTGTPIQNKLEDVFSLLHFLRVEPWCNWGWWNKLVQKPFEDGDERGLVLLKAILRPLMLRRTKDTTDKVGRPILVLPPSETEVVECEFSEAERDFYDALYKKSKIKFDQFVEQGKVLHNYASILELLLRMRQCCDHPFLVLSRGDTGEFSDLDKLARRFLDGGASTKAENGRCASVSKAYIQEVVDDLRKGNKAECPICLEAVEDAVLTPCAHCMCRECLLASWTSSAGGLCPICRQSMTRQDILTAPTESRFRVDVEKNWTESSKVAALMHELEALKKTGAKSIVFSQWTSFLDLLQIPLSRQNFRFVRLDGTLNQSQREKVIKDFSNNPKILVMLISLKAGGVGINLTAASNAFLLDPWWNPAVEEQAIMRIHRIGQTKKVSIKRFITKNSVEERMQQVQARKQRMIAGALTDQEIRSARIEELKMLFR
ncbi:hypothetical protein GOP47_0014249 [Adiantum capillus-veneris]|uniref:Uncharacterized protein n=1 Tax=Adiantum capillus-veneris TaxID=13818 RepID=A0A9D4UL82_ADICA|nr:hypothetical protein GOP47_0014249 [Adiantum capillus-veneris]